MKIFLACIQTVTNLFLSGQILPESVYGLESYYSIKKDFIPYMSRMKSFLLDSGAFTFINSSKKQTVDWNRYVDKYADFVRENRIRNYFELDIDSIVGLKEVERLRCRLERRVGWQSIPVFHINRGFDYFRYMCKDWKYVAFGGIRTDGYSTATLEKYFPLFIREAHINSTKLHAFGYMASAGLERYKFDTVDSSSWMHSRFGQYAVFKNGRIEYYTKNKLKRGRLKMTEQECKEHNLMEFLKYQRYAEIYL